MHERRATLGNATRGFVPHQCIQGLLHVDGPKHQGRIGGRVDILGDLGPDPHRADVDFAVPDWQSDLDVLRQPVRPPSEASLSMHTPLVVDHHLSVDAVQKLDPDVGHERYLSIRVKTEHPPHTPEAAVR